MNEEREIYTADSPDLQVGDVVHIGDAVVVAERDYERTILLRVHIGGDMYVYVDELHDLPITRKTPAQVKVTGTLVERIERDGKKLALVEVEE